jgi:hypothetical protein
LTNDGALYCWGHSATLPKRIGAEMTFSAVAVGDSYVCAIAMNGQTFCIGGGYGMGQGHSTQGTGERMIPIAPVGPIPAYVGRNANLRAVD